MPSGSLDPTELNATASGILPLVGVAVAAAIGAWFDTAATVTVAVPVAPLSSVTTRVATKDEAVA